MVFGCMDCRLVMRKSYVGEMCIWEWNELKCDMSVGFCWFMMYECCYLFFVVFCCFCMCDVCVIVCCIVERVGSPLLVWLREVFERLSRWSKSKKEKGNKGRTTPGIPTWSPTVVLTCPNMLGFAEQTGSGTLMLVWSFPIPSSLPKQPPN